jgi:hypothetical protein
LLDAMRSFTTLDRVRKCSKVPRSAGGVEVRVGQDGRAGYGNLCHCGSVWSCPSCAATVGAARAHELSQVMRWSIDTNGGSVLFASLTVQHWQGLALAATLSAIVAAWGWIATRREWRELRRAYGEIGYVRAVDCTCGVNGWHPHLHILIFFDRRLSAEDAMHIERVLQRLYQRGLQRQGYSCSTKHGVDVALATTRRDADEVLGKYLTKIACELTRNDTKRAKGGGCTPFELLAAAAAGDPASVALWQEWEQATFGRRQLEWSRARKDQPDIRTLAGLGKERDDQEIVDDDQGADTALIIPAEGWRKVWRERTDLLDVIEVHGLDAGRDWLRDRRVAWTNPAENREAWKPDPEITRELLRRSARTVLRR